MTLYWGMLMEEKMPNWYTTKVSVLGHPKHIKRLKSKHFVLDEKNVLDFDFNTIIPMPECLEGITSGSVVDDGVNAYRIGPATMWKFIVNHTPNDVAMVRKALKATIECGYHSWYNWCCNNWGTKWNAGALEINNESPTSLTFQFDTAWGPAEPVMKKLVAMHPHLSFDIVGHGEEDWECDDNGEPVEPVWSAII